MTELPSPGLGARTVVRKWLNVDLFGGALIHFIKLLAMLYTITVTFAFGSSIGSRIT